MNATLIVLKVVVAVVLLAGAPLALRRRWRLFLAVPLAVFQGFVPWSQVAGVPIPLAFWGGMVLWPELVREFQRVVAWKPTACIFGIAVLYSISLLWSPDPKLGLQPIGYFLQFLVIFAAVVAEGRRDEPHVLRLLGFTIALGLIQAVAIVIFRVMPGLKLAFYMSSSANWFISPNTLKMMFLTGQDNVLDPTKSGGMLGTNANFSATYLGIMTFAAVGIALYRGRRWWAVLGAVLLCAVPFVGSKAGLVLAVAMPVLAVQVISWRYRRWRNWLRLGVVGLLLFSAVAWIGPRAIDASEATTYRALSDLLSKSSVTLSTREKIWAFAPRAFAQHPFLGQGFGGWQASFAPYARTVGLSQDFPPHNTIIYLWSQGGLLAAIVGLAFMYWILKLGWRQMRDPEGSAFGLSLAMTFGFLWTFLQGMGENFGLIGDIHMSPLLACLLALSYLHRPKAPGAVEHGSDAGEPGSLVRRWRAQVRPAF